MSMFRVTSPKPGQHPMALMMLLLLLVMPGVALAGGTGAADLPYEEGLEVLMDSLTGPVAFGISVIGVVAAGAMLIFGGDMTGFMRSMVFVVLVIGLMVSAAGVLDKMFGITGAVIDAGATLIAPLANQGLC